MILGVGLPFSVHYLERVDIQSCSLIVQQLVQIRVLKGEDNLATCMHTQVLNMHGS